MKKYQRGGKLPKAQFGPVPMKPIKKSIDRIRKGPGQLRPDSPSSNSKKAKRYPTGLINEWNPKYQNAKKVVKKYLSGRIPADPDLPDYAGDFRKKAKSIRDKMQKGGSLRRSMKHK